MPWSIRWMPTDDVLQKIEAELAELQARHPAGFLVRLHVLGDFDGVAYVKRWHDWLLQFPALHIFGFTARHDDDTAKYIRILAMEMWGRFAIRSSDGKLAGIPASRVVERGAETDGIVCPAQQHKTQACGSCSLCWEAPNKTILFWPH